MRGMTVELRRPVEFGKDALGRAVRRWSEPEQVDGVLVLAGAAPSARESNRPDGVAVAYTLTFPKSYTESLRGCQVRIGGDWYDLDGDPQRQPDGQMRRKLRRWDRTAEAVRADG